MQKPAEEMRHFELIFIFPLSTNEYQTRVFTIIAGLNFAEYLLLGAAYTIQDEYYNNEDSVAIIF